MKIMIWISTEAYGDSLVLWAESGALKRELAARMTKTKLLSGDASGGVYISDYGTFYGDMTFLIVVKDCTVSEENSLWAMYTGGGNIIVSRFDGVFKGNISNLKTDSGIATITYLVEEKIS